MLYSSTVSLLLPVYFAHHGLDIHRSRGGSCFGLFHLFLLPDDDGMDAWASVPSILLQLGRTSVETESDEVTTVVKLVLYTKTVL